MIGKVIILVMVSLAAIGIKAAKSILKILLNLTTATIRTSTKLVICLFDSAMESYSRDLKKFDEIRYGPRQRFH